MPLEQMIDYALEGAARERGDHERVPVLRRDDQGGRAALPLLRPRSARARRVRHGAPPPKLRFPSPLPTEVFDLLTALVEKSLVVYEEDEQGRGRYRLLETVRQYSRDRLLESGKASGAGPAPGFFLRLAEQAEPGAEGTGPGGLAGPAGAGARQPASGAGVVAPEAVERRACGWAGRWRGSGISGATGRRGSSMWRGCWRCQGHGDPHRCAGRGAPMARGCWHGRRESSGPRGRSWKRAAISRETATRKASPARSHTLGLACHYHGDQRGRAGAGRKPGAFCELGVTGQASPGRSTAWGWWPGTREIRGGAAALRGEPGALSGGR